MKLCTKCAKLTLKQCYMLILLRLAIFTSLQYEWTANISHQNMLTAPWQQAANTEPTTREWKSIGNKCLKAASSLPLSFVSFSMIKNKHSPRSVDNRARGGCAGQPPRPSRWLTAASANCGLRHQRRISCARPCGRSQICCKGIVSDLISVVSYTQPLFLLRNQKNWRSFGA